MESFVSSDGVEIVYREWGSEYGGVPLVMHHGLAASSLTNWVTPGVADRIVADGRHVVAIDARGHGGSGKPHDIAAYADAQMVTDVSLLIDELRVERVDLAGYSMGGHVAIDVAIREPRLRSVVIGGVGGAALRPRSIDRRLMIDAMLAPSLDDVEDHVARQFRRFADRTGADLLALAAVAQANAYSAAGIEGIAIPTLVLVGADDPLAVGADQLAAAIPGAELVVVPGDHLAAVGSVEFTDAIATFLGRVEQNEASRTAPGSRAT